MVKLVANMHGNEVSGRETLLDLAIYLLHNYGRLNRVTKLVDNTDIHILPTLNPDGFARAERGDCYPGPGRPNANGVDLNRDFPQPKDLKKSFRSLMMGRQPEV